MSSIGRDAELLLIGMAMADAKIRETCRVVDFWECADIAREVIGCSPGHALKAVAATKDGEKTRDALIRTVRERTQKKREIKLLGQAWREIGDLRMRASAGRDAKFGQIESLKEILTEIVRGLDGYESKGVANGTLPSVSPEERKSV